MPSIAWVALRSDIADATLPLYEVEEREDDIPRHSSSIVEKVGQVGKEAHILRPECQEGVKMRTWLGTKK